MSFQEVGIWGPGSTPWDSEIGIDTMADMTTAPAGVGAISLVPFRGEWRRTVGEQPCDETRSHASTGASDSTSDALRLNTPADGGCGGSGFQAGRRF